MSQAQGKAEAQDNAETRGAAGNFITFDLRALTHFQEDRPYVQILSDTGAARVVLFAFKAGQQLKEHTTTSQILVQVLRGRATFSAQGSSVILKAGMIIQLEENIPHSVFAQTDAVMLLTLTPSPARRGLEQDIFQGRTPLVERATEK